MMKKCIQIGLFALLIAAVLLAGGCARKRRTEATTTAAITTAATTTAELHRFEHTPSADGQGVVLTRYIGSGTELTVPSELEGLAVVSIASGAFADAGSLERLILPDSLRLIEEGALAGCGRLTYLSVPFVGREAEQGSVRRETMLGYLFGSAPYEGAEAVMQYAGTDRTLEFYVPATLSELEIRGGSLRYGALSGITGLKRCHIGDVVEMDRDILRGCGALETLTVPFVGSTIDSADTVGHFFGIQEYPHSRETFQLLEDQTEMTYYLPEGLREVTVQGGYVAGGSFHGCATLTRLVLGEGITEICQGALMGCESLEELTVPFVGGSTDPEIDLQGRLIYLFGVLGRVEGEIAFYYALPESLDSVTVTGGWIGDQAFRQFDMVRRITLEEDVSGMGTKAFYGCRALEQVEIRCPMTSIPAYTFYGCSSLETLQLPHGITEIGDSAFNGCRKLTDLPVREGLTKIGQYAFQGCRGLVSVVLPDSVEQVGYAAFRNCTSLLRLDTGDSLREIALYAFDGCTSLTHVTVGASVTLIRSTSFEGCEYIWEVCNLSVCDAAKSFPSARHVYTDRAEPSYIETRGDFVLYMPVGEVGTLLFSTEDVGETLDLPVYTDGRQYELLPGSFRGNTDLRSVILPDCVVGIGDRAFDSCSSLQTVQMGAGLVRIGLGAFNRCTSLSEVTLPAALTELGASAFCDCYALSSVTFLGDSLDVMGSSVFLNCRSLTAIALPRGLKAVANYTFMGASLLTEVSLGEALCSVGKSAFSGCGSLQRIRYAGTQAQWNGLTVEEGNEPLTSAQLLPQSE